MPGTITLQPIQANLSQNIFIEDPHFSLVLGNQHVEPYRVDDAQHLHWKSDSKIILKSSTKSNCALELVDEQTIFSDDVGGRIDINLKEIGTDGHLLKWYPISKEGKNAGKLLFEIFLENEKRKSQGPARAAGGRIHPGYESVEPLNEFEQDYKNWDQQFNTKGQEQRKGLGKRIHPGYVNVEPLREFAEDYKNWDQQFNVREQEQEQKRDFCRRIHPGYECVEPLNEFSQDYKNWDQQLCTRGQEQKKELCRRTHPGYECVEPLNEFSQDYKNWDQQFCMRGQEQTKGLGKRIHPGYVGVEPLNEFGQDYASWYQNEKVQWDI